MTPDPVLGGPQNPASATPNQATPAQDDALSDEQQSPPSTKRRALLVAFRVLGLALALTAITLCVLALVDAWPTVSEAIADASIGWLAVGLVCSALAVIGQAALWYQVLVTFDRHWPMGKVGSWYFAGELGKYLPGGIWPVVGRGELARRGGVARPTAYSTTLLAMALMCIGAAIACGLLAPFLALDDEGLGAAWLLLLLIPLGIAFAHPAVSGFVFGLVAKISKGRVTLSPPSFGGMLRLLAVGTPGWLFLGAGSCAITQALGYDMEPARVAFAAIAAWLVGFLAVPVPAGAGVRELVFVALCGLDSGPAVAVAAIARLMLILTDAVGGAVALLAVRRAGSAADGSAAPSGSAGSTG